MAISEYVANLRKHVGKDLLMLPSACAVVNDEESSAVGWYSTEELPDLDAVDQLSIETALDDDAPTWFAAPG
jgi:hypothetical protein